MIAFDIGPIRFQYRAGAVAVHGGRVLVARADGTDYCFLPGGRVEAGETAQEALRRELHEELEAEARVGRLLWIAEDFFRLDGRPFHEVALFFEVELPPEFLDARLMRHDPSDRITLFWQPLDALAAAGLQPAFLRGALAALPTGPQHIVARDG